MGLREWLLVCGIVFVLLLLLDGVRRYFGRNTLKFKLDRKLISQFSEEPHNPEILGPVRVSKQQEPVIGDPDFSDDEPMESEEERQGNLYLDEPIQAQLDNFDPIDELDNLEIKLDDPISSQEITTEEPQDYEDFLVLYVESPDEVGFDGQDLLQCVLESGMRYGDMDIFHRHESLSGTGSKLFSMANALKPGTFDLDNMEESHIRVVCFFMSLPGPKQPKQAFELMLNAARKLADELDGELKDDNRSDLTSQTIEHYRLKVMEFERRQMMPRN